MLIKVKVKPSSGRQEVEKISDDEYKIWLKSPPEDGKANAELLKLLKKELGIKGKLKSGKSSRNKVVEVYV